MPKRPKNPSARRYRYRIGYEGEYYLVKKFVDKRRPGYYAVRTPGSGTGKMLKPDVLAVDNGEFYAIEVKSTTGHAVYLPPDQVRRLVEFTELFQLRCPSCNHLFKPTPVIAVRFLNKGWVFTKVNDVNERILVRSDADRR
ncbi:MAG: hypothetical protein NZ920_02025 [Aigarchaeota archaeon]|nr:hypothetical protein [Aigarchaeota archaeon]MDW8092597.1 hypothetical protein [Nitrososphaerota archaeon]